MPVIALCCAGVTIPSSRKPAKGFYLEVNFRLLTDAKLAQPGQGTSFPSSGSRVQIPHFAPFSLMNDEFY